MATRASISAHLLSTGIGLASIALALSGVGALVSASGMIYFLMGPAHGLHGWLWGKRIEAAAQGA